MPQRSLASLRRRRRRREKTRDLKERIAKTQDESKRRKLIQKLERVNPFLKQPVA